MKKLLLGFFALCVFAFSAPVSFASDGPETTKECVVDIDSTMEVVAQIDEVEVSVANAIVLGTEVSYLIEKSYTGLEKDYEIKNPANYIEKYAVIHIDPGVTKINLLNYHKNLKTNGTAFKFINKNCLTRYLLDS